MRSISRWAAGCPSTHAMLLASAFLLPVAAQAATVTIQPIYFFPIDKSMGTTPSGGLVVDSAGRLYGTTQRGGVNNDGTVYRLTPPSGGQGAWTAENLHNFNFSAEGSSPGGAVTLDAAGNVYGTVPGSQTNCGSVFKLSNTANWPITILHEWLCANGAAKVPEGNLVFGPGHLLYGTTAFESRSSPALEGTDFSVSPAGDTTEFDQIATFGQPGEGAGPTALVPVPGTTYLVGATDALSHSTFYALDANAAGSGTIFPLHTFGNNAADVNGSMSPPIVGTGTLQGSAFGCAMSGGSGGSGYPPAGGIYKEDDKNGHVTESVIFNFPDSTYPYANGGFYCSLIQGDSTGTIYGITQTEISAYTNAFFQLTPPTQTGGTWSEQVLSYFTTSGAFEPQYPIAKIGNNYYIAFEVSDNTNNGDGVVMQITVTP